VNMKPLPSDDRDSPLGGLLKEWKVRGSLPPRFQERVWKRIALADAGTRQDAAAGWVGALGAWLGSLQKVLSRPGLAAGYVTALLVLGFAAGWERGVKKSAHIGQSLSSRYVQSVDPYKSTLTAFQEMR